MELIIGTIFIVAIITVMLFNYWIESFSGENILQAMCLVPGVIFLISIGAWIFAFVSVNIIPNTTIKNIASVIERYGITMWVSFVSAALFYKVFKTHNGLGKRFLNVFSMIMLVVSTLCFLVPLLNIWIWALGSKPLNIWI